MRRNYSRRSRNSSSTDSAVSYYNVAVLHRYREISGLTVHAVGNAIGMNPDTCSKVFKGHASQKQLWRVAGFFAAKLSMRVVEMWIQLHNLSLRTRDEIDRAVFPEKAVRSSGPARVGVSQARSVKRERTYRRVER